MNLEVAVRPPTAIAAGKHGIEDDLASTVSGLDSSQEVLVGDLVNRVAAVSGAMPQIDRSAGERTPGAGIHHS